MSEPKGTPMAELEFDQLVLRYCRQIILKTMFDLSVRSNAEQCERVPCENTSRLFVDIVFLAGFLPANRIQRLS